MVKNTHGGSKHKSFAKKHSQASKASIRLPNDDLELFAYVSTFHGNHFEAHTHKYPKITTFIRNKFAKHNKYSNTVSRGSIVLIGLRDWEAPNYKNADLLEVYDANDISLLSNYSEYKIQELIRKATGDTKPSDTSNEILFTNDEELDSNIHTLLSENSKTNDTKDTTPEFMTDEIDIDDI